MQNVYSVGTSWNYTYSDGEHGANGETEALRGDSGDYGHGDEKGESVDVPRLGS